MHHPHLVSKIMASFDIAENLCQITTTAAAEFNLCLFYCTTLSDPCVTLLELDWLEWTPTQLGQYSLPTSRDSTLHWHEIFAKKCSSKKHLGRNDTISAMVRSMQKSGCPYLVNGQGCWTYKSSKSFTMVTWHDMMSLQKIVPSLVHLQTIAQCVLCTARYPSVQNSPVLTQGYMRHWGYIRCWKGVDTGVYPRWTRGYVLGGKLQI